MLEPTPASPFSYDRQCSSWQELERRQLRIDQASDLPGCSEKPYLSKWASRSCVHSSRCFTVLGFTFGCGPYQRLASQVGNAATITSATSAVVFARRRSPHCSALAII